MHRVGRGVHRRVERAPGQRLVETAETRGDVVRRRIGSRTVAIGIDSRHQRDTGQLAELLGVTVGDMARAEDQEPLVGSTEPRLPGAVKRRPAATIGSRACSTGTFGASPTSVQAGAGL